MATASHITDPVLNEIEHVSLCETLDRVLNKGAVLVGEMTISVAGIDLLYLGIQLVLSSIKTAWETKNPTASF